MTLRRTVVLAQGKENSMDTSMVRIVCAVLAILFLGVIVLRRKKSAED
jgi:hypothetical protein